MLHSITISEPTKPPQASFAGYVTSMILLSVMGISSIILAFGAPTISIALLMGITGVGMLILVIYSFLDRQKNQNKRLITFDDKGITFLYDNTTQVIEWDAIDRITLTFIFYTSPGKPTEGYPYMLFTVKNRGLLPPTLSVERTGKPTIYFVAHPSDFVGFIGEQAPYSFAINAEHYPEVDANLFFGQFGKTISTSRPIMQVHNNTEYNELLKKSYSAEKVNAYQLPVDSH